MNHISKMIFVWQNSFKMFVSKFLTDFSSKMEFQNSPYREIFAGNTDMFILKSLVEGKDEIILLKDEIKHLREQNKTLIDQRQNR